MEHSETTTWGPQRRRASVSATFDNQGEAYDISMDRRPASGPISPVGFRPSGGVVDGPSLALLKEQRFTYCSPVASDSSVRFKEEPTIIPFAWRHVDTYLIAPDLNHFRVAHGNRTSPVSAEEWEQILKDGFDATLAGREHVTVIFHPYLFGADERLWQVMRRFLARLRAQDDAWLALCSQVAEWGRVESRTAWPLTQRRSYRHRAVSLTSPGRPVS
jgi:hypothetical protein